MANDDEELLGNTTEWLTNNKRSSNNKHNESVNNYNKLKRFEHPNRFNALQDKASEVFENNCDVVDHTIYHNTQPSQNHKRNSRPHIITQRYPENNFIKMPIRPGANTYNQAVKDGKKAVVYTSITKGINVRDFNNSYKIGTAIIRRFHSAKARHVKHYVTPTLIEESPQVVLLQCGGNDLQTIKLNPTPVETIANDIIETGKFCENHGAEHILISGIIKRNKQPYIERRRRQINNILKDMCFDLGYIYIDNENIEIEHLFNDGVHLNPDGSDILSGNLLHSLNNIY